jgi:hypothetical protein
MRTELGLLKRSVLPATNTAGALQQFQTEIASLAFGRTHDVQLIIIFISLTKIKDIVENLDELPNRILPNLAHLLILCAFTSVLCGVNKEVNENNNNKNQIQSWSFIYKHGEIQSGMHGPAEY